MALLAHRRDVRTNLAKDFCTHTGAKATRDFLLDFHHSDISLSLIIIKRDVEIIHKGERFFTIITESVKQVFCLGLFLAPTPRLVRGRRRYIGSKAFAQDSLIAPLEFCNGDFIEESFTSLPSIINSFFNLEQMSNHLI